MEKEKELDFDCTHCEHYIAESRDCAKKYVMSTNLQPCVDFKLKQTQFTNEFLGLFMALTFSFIQPTKQPISEEKTAKAKELAKAAKAAMDKGEKFEIKEGTELYEDTELFSAYTSELAKILMIDNLNKETAKVAAMKKATLAAYQNIN